VFSAVEIDSRLAGATDRIVGVTDDGGFVEFDLAAGEIRTLAGSRAQAGTSYAPIAGADWIVSLRDDGGSARVFIGESAVPEVLNTTDPYSIIWQYGTDLFWKMDYDVTTGRPAAAVEFDLTGRDTGRTIDIGGMWMLGSDMVGGVLLNTGSIGLYRADAEGSERLPDGQVVAISPTHLLLYSCGENLNTCGLRRVDRASGESQPVPVEQDVLNIVTTSIGWWAPAPATPTISADGGAAIVISAAEGVPEVAIIDLTEGTFTLIGGAGNSMMYANPSAGWSADGRFAYAVVESTLTAFDRTTGESFPVVTTVPVDASVAEVYAIAVRPPPAG
jgi:hypothetical protein